jgi:mRNA-degrading endonuclease toxin of MazEF toxin-antitoxin module
VTLPLPIVIGGIYWVADEALTMPPNDERKPHPRRMVLVLSGPSNADPDWPLVQVMPLSSQASRTTRYCVKIAAGQGNVMKKCWVRVPMAQPLLKADLADGVGVLPGDLLEEVQARYLQYLGLADEDEDKQKPEL